MTEPLLDRLAHALGPGYRLERELGGGGMSRVFLATDLSLDRRIVVKVLAPELAEGVSVERFRREILVAAGLQHPHVVPVLSAGEVAGLPWFTMPYVEGDSLRTRLTGGPVEPSAAVAILRDIARGLAAAHSRGIVHRDIKPENVLLSGSSAAVTDFGVAKALSTARQAADEALTVVGMSLGTPAYIAPEQAAGDPAVDHRADIYALGVVAYEMLAGHPPFHGRAPQALIAAHLVEPAPPLAEQAPGAPPALAALVMRCLAKDPADRPQSADEFVTALDAAPAGPPRLGRRTALVGAVAMAILTAAVVLLAWRASRPGGGGTELPLDAIAVLPLVNTGGDAQDEYFSDGMTDELAAALSRVGGLRVASRTSAYAFKGRTGVDVREIGRQLGVGAVLEGTVRREGDRLRLAAQLTDTRDGLSLWSETYERRVEDVFEVQDELAGAIAAALAPRLADRRDTAAPATESLRTSDLAAYDLYLRGRYHWHQRGAESLRRAADYFEQATARDPDFAAAHAGLADALVLLPIYGTTPADSALPLARAAAERALALQPTLPDAHTTLALVHKAEGKWAAAERALQQALALDSTAAAAHQWHGEVLFITGRLAEAAQAMERAHRLDPLSPVIAGELGYMRTLAGDTARGLAVGRRAVEMAPDLWTGHAFYGSALIFAGRPGDGVPELERAVALDPGVTLFQGILAYAYARSGREADARRIVTELENRDEPSETASALAVAYVGLGEHGRALDWLERAAELRDPYLLQMSLAGAWFDPLRSEPRFAAVAEQLGLDPAVMGRLRSPAHR